MKIKNLKLKIVFFGTPPFIESVIRKLEENFEVVKQVRKPQQFNNRTIEQFRSSNPDLFVVAAYGQFLPPSVLSIPKYGAINIHPSLLPKYRGASPIQSAILNGDEKTGVTFFKMDEKLDHGPIIEQFEEPILETDTFESLAKRLFQKAADEAVSVIAHFSKNPAVTAQNDSEATFTKQLTKQDGFLDLSSLKIARPAKLGRSGENLKLKIRAFYPWPSVWTRYPLTPQKSLKTLIKLLPNEQIQVEGKKPMSYKDFINGYEKGQEFLKKIGLFSN